MIALRMTSHRWLPKALMAVLIGLAVWQLGSAAYIAAKAELAQWLLEDAWQLATQDGGRHRPWDWADTWPVAKLRSAQHGQELIVLEGASGRNLAFGPAHVSATAEPGGEGNSVIAGHRDTHFAWLRDIALGEELVVETLDGSFTYRVTDIDIVDEAATGIMADQTISTITLVTCYPFDAIDPGTDLRFVVVAQKQIDALPNAARISWQGPSR